MSKMSKSESSRNVQSQEKLTHIYSFIKKDKLSKVNTVPGARMVVLKELEWQNKGINRPVDVSLLTTLLRMIQQWRHIGLIYIIYYHLIYFYHLQKKYNSDIIIGYSTTCRNRTLYVFIFQCRTQLWQWALCTRVHINSDRNTALDIRKKYTKYENIIQTYSF